MTEGPHPIPNDRDSREMWFEWQGTWDEGGYKRIEKPECTKTTINWGIG